MNNKGFTLVELMGILVVLALILVVAVPAITSTFRSMEETRLEEYKETICAAALVHFNIHGSAFAQDPTGYSVTVQQLIEHGFVADSIRNPIGHDNANVFVLIANHWTPEPYCSICGARNPGYCVPWGN